MHHRGGCTRCKLLTGAKLPPPLSPSASLLFCCCYHLPQNLLSLSSQQAAAGESSALEKGGGGVVRVCGGHSLLNHGWLATTGSAAAPALLNEKLLSAGLTLGAWRIIEAAPAGWQALLL